MIGPVVRPLDATEVEALVALSLRAWEPVFESMQKVLGEDLFSRLYPDGWRSRQDRDVREACATKTVFVGVLGGTIAGFVAVDTASDSLEGEIHMIAVGPNHQRQGVGAALFEFAIDQIRSAGLPIARVGTGGDAGHGPARALYERFGFTPLPIFQYFQLVSDQDSDRTG